MKFCRRCSLRFESGLVVCPRDGEALLDDPAALIGTLLDGIYEVESLLGRGGMGAVYKARHVLLRDVVAIKVVPPDIARPGVVNRFLREGRATRSIRHPNAVAVHDLRTTADGLVYMVLEFVDGHSLRTELRRRGRIPPGDTLAILAPVALALEAAHAEGIVHRDVKPDNVMIGSANGGRLVKLLDLGIAKLRDARLREESAPTTLTGPGQILGTPFYMSPEQWGVPPIDSGPEIDGRADVYSLGVVAYEMLAGTRPFSGETLDEVKRAHLHGTPTPLDHLAPLVSAEMAGVVRRALERDRTRRQASPVAFVEELRSATERVDPSVDESSTSQLATAPTARLPPTDFERTLTGTHSLPIPHNLPQQYTSFVGRSLDLVGVRKLVAGARLVTITGPGGIGKTRLSVEVASSLLRDFPGGVWFVELAGLHNPDFVPGAVAAACGLEEKPNRAPLVTLVSSFGTGAALFVLDNCEHLLDACARFGDALLRACPFVRIVATSRENLGVTGEAIWRLNSLSYPDLDGTISDPAQLLDYEAARLFEERATLASPAFRISAENAAVVARICGRLEGIPLALELAAARIKAFGPRQVLAKLDEGFRILSATNRAALPRHRALEAAIGWSYELLSEQERALFGRLSVFSGGWDLEAAEFVCGAAAPSRGDRAAATGPDSRASDTPARDLEDVWEILAHLVDKSLVSRDDVGSLERYRYPIPIRQYAAERLQALGEHERLSARHCEWYLRITEEAFDDFARGSHERWRERLAADRDNLRAALEYSGTLADDSHSFARLCLALGPFWDMYGRWSEGRRWLDRALARDDLPMLLRARALFRAGSLAVRQGDHERARVLLTESSELMRTTGAELGLAHALSQLGAVESNMGRYGRATELLREALGIYRATKQPYLMASAIVMLGGVARAAGTFDDATKWLEEGLALYQAIGFDQGIGLTLCELGMVARHCGDLDRAERLLTESAEVLKRGDFTHQIALAAYGLAEVRRHRGDLDGAHELYIEAIEVEQRMGAVADLARVLEGFCATAAALGNSYRALVLAGAAEALRDTIGVAISPVEQVALAESLQDIDNLVDEATSRTARARGRALTVDQAVEFAVGLRPEPPA
jgi:predicted ATPase/serine/threonine protein kinase